MNESAQFSGFHQGVRERAYALWEREGRPFGRHVEHWRVSEEAARGGNSRRRAGEEGDIESSVAQEGCFFTGKRGYGNVGRRLTARVASAQSALHDAAQPPREVLRVLQRFAIDQTRFVEQQP